MTYYTPKARKFVAWEDVKCLQLRALSASSADQQAIDRLFHKGIVFRRIQDEGDYNTLRRKIKSIKSIIPSLLTFYKNIKYISISLGILQQYVLKLLRNSTLYEYLQET